MSTTPTSSSPGAQPGPPHGGGAHKHPGPRHQPKHPPGGGTGRKVPVADPYADVVNLTNMMFRPEWMTMTASVVPDVKAAAAAGHLDDNGEVAPPGTYTTIGYVLAFMHPSPTPGGSPVLDLVDLDGAFCRFTWDLTASRWTSVPGVVTFPGATHGRYPTLALGTYGDTDAPPGATKGDRHLHSVGDPSVEHVMETQYLTYDVDADSITWSCLSDPPPHGGLELPRQYRQPSMAAGSAQTTKAFGEVFVGQYHFAQAAYPFYGFDPRRMELYPTGAPPTGGPGPCFELTPAGPGTPSAGIYGSNPGQGFTGALVFAFPAKDSLDYVSGVDVDNTPYLPLGVLGTGLDWTTATSRTKVISSLKDRMEAYSFTLGLNAGVPKMLSAGGSASYTHKVDRQTTTESRYTVSWKVTRDWVAKSDVPSLSVSPAVKGEITSRVKVLLAEGADAVDWPKFVSMFGTHYAHAITYGRLEMSETRFSLRAESKLTEQKLDLKTQSSAVLDGVKVAGSNALSTEWARTNKVSISEEDIDTVSLGADYPVAISFDLRPLTELFSPAFFPYLPDSQVELEKHAPCVWYDLRAGLAAYLESIGLDQPFSTDELTDFTPRRVQVSFTSIAVSGPDIDNVATGADSQVGTPSVAVEDAATYVAGGGQLPADFLPAGMHPDDTNPIVDQCAPSRSENDAWVKLAAPGWQPAPDKFHATILARPGGTEPLRFLVSASIPVYHWEVPFMSYRGTYVYQRTVSFVRAVTVPPGQTTATCSGAAGPYTVTVQLAVQDLGPLLE